MLLWQGYSVSSCFAALSITRSSCSSETFYSGPTDSSKYSKPLGESSPSPSSISNGSTTHYSEITRGVPWICCWKVETSLVVTHWLESGKAEGRSWRGRPTCLECLLGEPRRRGRDFVGLCGSVSGNRTSFWTPSVAALLY